MSGWVTQPTRLIDIKNNDGSGGILKKTYKPLHSYHRGHLGLLFFQQMSCWDPNPIRIAGTEVSFLVECWKVFLDRLQKVDWFLRWQAVC